MATVMIVDDDPDMRVLIRAVLEMTHTGLTVVGEASDGLEALVVWRALGGSPDPDAVVLDNRIPGMSGLEVAAQILQERPSQVIVMCTAFPDHGTRTRAAEVGITHCVSKSDLNLLPSLIGMSTASRPPTI